MKGSIVYYCDECGKTKEKNDEKNRDDEVPVFCCNKPMKMREIEACMKSGSSAEHARFSDDDEPCDEGRGQ